MSTATDLRTGRVRSLDGLRGLAVAMVFAFHVRPGLLRGGYQGVMLFFALSGFLITSLLLDEWRQRRSIHLRAFYLRRALRLMPALVVMVIVTVSANVVLGTFTAATLKDAAAGLTYLMDIYAPAAHTLGGGYNHTWSLAVEEQFYLLWPGLLILALRRRWSLVRLVGGWMLVLTAVTAALTLSGAIDRDGMYRIPTTHFPVIGAGILLAVLLDSERRTKLTAALRHPVVPYVSLAGTALLLFGTAHADTWLYTGGYPAAGLLFAAMIGSTIAAPASRVARALTCRPLVWLGRRSYGFYLWHAPLLTLLVTRVHNWFVYAAVGLVLSLVATVLSWRIVEAPFLRMKKRFEPAPVDQVDAGVIPQQSVAYQPIVASS